MGTQIQKLEQLHQLVNNEVNRPKFLSFIKTNVGNLYFTDVNEHILNPNGNCFDITDDIEKEFLLDCILNDDYTAFLYEENNGKTNESDWERFTENILTKIN